MSFAAIDQGTTSTRVLRLGDDGQLRVVHSVKHAQFYPHNGWVEHDPEELIRNIQACADAAGVVDAIGIDNQGESCLAWDAHSKRALSPVIVWQDNRTSAKISTLKSAGHEGAVLDRAGLPLDPYFSASKLAWIVENIPAARDAHSKGTLRLGTTDAFFLDRLTGKCVTDATTASRTSLMHLENLTWDPVLCDLFGVPIETLPEIVPTTGDFGAIPTRNGAVPVTASIVDQQAALYGFGCRNRGDAKITFGTGAFALMVTGEAVFKKPEKGLLPTVAWHFSGEAPVYALDGGVYTASAALNWAQSLGLFQTFDQIDSFSSGPAIDSGLAFVPALSGLGCPFWNDAARGTWLGMTLDHGAPDLVQSILEGVGFRAAQVIDAMADCAELSKSLPIDGGMSRNTYFRQFLADVLDRNILAAKMPELTGIGTLQLAAKGAGVELQSPIEFESVTPGCRHQGSKKRFAQACAIAQSWSV